MLFFGNRIKKGKVLSNRHKGSHGPALAIEQQGHSLHSLVWLSWREKQMGAALFAEKNALQIQNLAAHR